MPPELAPDRPARRFGVGVVIVAALAALAITVGIGIWRQAVTPVETVQVDGAAATGEPAPGGGAAGARGAGEDVTAAGVWVHVAGAVAAPGLYRLDAGARVADAIAVAGGFAPDADRAGVNLARSVLDGEQLLVPVVGQAPPVSSTAAAGDGVVDLNTADVDALDTLPRVGPAIAQRIVQWRETNGPFTSVEDLLAVPGIGDRMLESLRDLVRV